jgi:hypothetical protein
VKEKTVKLQLPEGVQTTAEAAAREEWLSKGSNHYTPEVCRQTLQLNEEFPIHEE